MIKIKPDEKGGATGRGKSFRWATVKGDKGDGAKECQISKETSSNRKKKKQS